MRGCLKWSCAHARPEMTSPEVTGNDVTGNERELISRVFFTVFPAFFPELTYILGKNNGIFIPTNRSPSDI